MHFSIISSTISEVLANHFTNINDVSSNLEEWVSDKIDVGI